MAVTPAFILVCFSARARFSNERFSIISRCQKNNKTILRTVLMLKAEKIQNT
jgi:hypothetical protein